MRKALLTVLIFLASVSTAIAGNPFEITGVRIDAHGANVTSAREQAIRVGTLDATYRLLDRLTLPEDRLILDPPLVITEDVAEQLVAGIQIANERRSRSRYLGDLSVTFDAQLIRAFLRAQNLPFVESQARPILIVALWQDEEGLIVSTSDNPLARILKDQGYQNNLVPLALAEFMPPQDGLDDEGVQRAWQLANLETETIREIATRFGVENLIISRARKTGHGVIRIQAHRVAVENGFVGSILNMGSFEGNAPFGTNPNDADASALRSATQKIARVIETEWKQAAIVREGERQSVILTALYNTLAEWQSLRDALGGEALVEEARLDAFSIDGALLTLTYFGSEEQLARRLAQKGILLRNEDIGLVAQIR